MKEIELPTHIVLPGRFTGPPTSAHGGYASGVMARFIGNGAEVTLRKPPPLETPIRIERDAERVLALYDGDLVMEARAATPRRDDLPSAPSIEQARATTPSPAVLNEHVFPTCFACGPARAPGDGLRIFAGRVHDRLLATTWTPHESLEAGDGLVARPFLWAALDCPGAWAPMNAMGRAAPLLLGRIVGAVVRDVKIGEELIVSAWFRGQDGRKHFTGTALHDAGGGLVAHADHTWIEQRPRA